MQKLFLAPDAQTRLLQVVRCNEESMLIAVSVHQRFAFVVIAVFRQAVADPADAGVIRTVQRYAVPGQRAIGGGELVGARARVGGLLLRLLGRKVEGEQEKAGSKQAPQGRGCR